VSNQGVAHLSSAFGASAPRSRRRRIGDASSLGALANTGASALRLGCQLALLPILARLIGPSEYGLVALAMPVVLIANVIADGGLVQALGRLPEADRTVESSAFWVTMTVGLVLALGACAAAFPVGWAMGQPRLPWLILALSPILVMNSVTAVSNGRIIRERRFGVFAMGDVLATLAGAAAALLAATHGWGAWSLIAQQLALWVAKLLWITLRGGAQVGFVFRFAEVRDLIGFGANNIGATIADFVAKNIDNMIIGGVLGATSLGYYAMAYQVVRVPDMLISGPFWFYVFTAVSRLSHRDDRAGIRELAKSGLRLGAVALAPLFCGLALVADLVVAVVFGPKWTGAIGPLQLLAGAGFAFCLCSLMSAMLMGLGRAGLQFRLSLLMGASTVATVGAAARFGLEPAAGALACGVAAVGLYYLHQLGRTLHASRLGLLGALAPAFIGCVALTAAVGATRQGLRDAPPALVLGAAILAGAAAYLAVVLIVARRRLAADARAFARAHADATERELAAEVEGVEATKALNPAG